MKKYERYLEFMPDFRQEKTQKFTTVVLTLIAFIILLIFAINPTLSTIAKLQKQVEDAKFVKEKMDEKINNLSILQTKYSSLQPDLPTVYEAVPKKAEPTLLLAQIQALVKESNLSLVSLQVLEVSTANVEDFSSYSFDISARGDYKDMLNFLENITNMERVLGLSSISIKRQTEGSGTVLQVNIQGQALFKS